jgi:hypothetical protein
MPFILITDFHTLHNKILNLLFKTDTPKFSPQNMPFILPHSHSTCFTTKYAMYTSTQTIHNSHNKICHVLFLTASPHTTPQNMPCTLHDNYFQVLQHKTYNLFFPTATGNCSMKNMPCTLPYTNSKIFTKNMPCNPPHGHSTLFNKI